MFPVTFNQQDSVSRAQRHLQDRPGKEQPVRGDAIRVAPPGVEQASLSAAVIPRAATSTRSNRVIDQDDAVLVSGGFFLHFFDYYFQRLIK